MRRGDHHAVGQPAGAAAVVAAGSRATRAGVGVKPSSASTSTCTPLAANTSTAVTQAGSDSACVSRPRNSGPSVPCAARYSQMAWLVAAMWSSLNVVLQRRAAVPGGAERDPLRRVLRVRVAVVVGGQQRRRGRPGPRAGRALPARGSIDIGVSSFGRRRRRWLPHTLPSGRHRRQDLPAPFPAEPKDRRRVVDNSPAHGPRDACRVGARAELDRARERGVGGLTVHRAERADALADALAELLAEPAGRPVRRRGRRRAGQGCGAVAGPAALAPPGRGRRPGRRGVRRRRVPLAGRGGRRGGRPPPPASDPDDDPWRPARRSGRCWR